MKHYVKYRTWVGYKEAHGAMVYESSDYNCVTADVLRTWRKIISESEKQLNRGIVGEVLIDFFTEIQ